VDDAGRDEAGLCAVSGNDLREYTPVGVYSFELERCLVSRKRCVHKVYLDTFYSKYKKFSMKFTF
jgi:hypothetical protein